MKDLLETVPEDLREEIEERNHPDWCEPMLATLSHETFSREGWLFERKLDGVRCLAFRKGDALRLLSRNQESRNDTYPELEAPLLEQGSGDFVVDGEIVAFTGKVTSFSRLQQRMKIRDRDEAKASSVAIYFYLFDLLHLDGCDLTGLPLRQRKRLLRKAFDFGNRVRFTPHRNEEGEAFHREACDKGWEGVIAKDGESDYVHGRSRKWLKFKCAASQELVIGGFTEPEGERKGFGALLLGFYRGGELHYAGEVGTGFDDDFLEEFRGRLERIERETPPFVEEKGLPRKGVHWVTPDYVAEIAFTEWTDDDKLRHPRFKGLRDDKDPEDVVKEA